MTQVRGELPNEQILTATRLHWIIYLPAFLLFSAGVAMLGVHLHFPDWPFLLVGMGFFWVYSAVNFARAWLMRLLTELLVTNLRVIYKNGLVWRETIEWPIEKVESVRVDQSIIGRILGYGTIELRGIGLGVERFHNITIAKGFGPRRHPSSVAA